MNALLFLPLLAQQSVTSAGSGAPLRVFAAILLILIFSGVVYVLRHLTRVKRSPAGNDLIRDNLILIAGAVTLLAVGLLLFLLLKA